MKLKGSRALQRVVNIEDLRQLARKRVPLPIFDYLDGGADDEVTLRDNRQSWNEVLFRPHNAVSIPKPNLRRNILGCDLAMPMLLGPIGFTRLMNSQAERAVAAAAGDAGLGFCMSSFSGYTCQSVAEVAKGPLWYQLYLAGGRHTVEATLDRAWTAGFKILAVTIDTNVPGNRERDLHNGASQIMSGNMLRMLPYLPSIFAKPRWVAQFMADREAMFFPNIQLPGRGPCRASDVRVMLDASAVTWDDMKWIRRAWPGRIVTKGVMTAEDARRAFDTGSDGVIVSNHGGRQLDTCCPTLRALPEIIRAVGERGTILVDGGIRRGSDIIKALCMGADAVLIGRAYAYGLAAEGRAGVARTIDILKTDMERTMALLGCASVEDLNSSFVSVPQHWTPC